jgi:hypothetical protein
MFTNTGKWILQDVVLSGTRCGAHTTVGDMFVGDHVSYPVGECKLVSDIKICFFAKCLNIGNHI